MSQIHELHTQYVSWCLCPLSRTLHIFECSLLVLLMSNYKNDIYHWKQPLVQFSQIICEAGVCYRSENIAFMLSWKSFHWSRTFLTPHKWKGSYSLYWCNRIVPPFFLHHFHIWSKSSEIPICGLSIKEIRRIQYFVNVPRAELHITGISKAKQSQLNI